MGVAGRVCLQLGEEYLDLGMGRDGGGGVSSGPIFMVYGRSFFSLCSIAMGLHDI